MHLTEVRLGGICDHSRPVLNSHPQVGVSRDTKPLQQRDCLTRWLRKSMCGVAAHRQHDGRQNLHHERNHSSYFQAANEGSAIGRCPVVK